MKLIITQEIYLQLIKAAENAAPLEACGLLAGNGPDVTKFYEMTNADASPEHFTMLPEEQFTAIKDMRVNKTEMLAIWHSHPETPPRMSEEDIKLAYMPGIVHVILSLANKNNHEIKGYQVNDGVPEQIEIQLPVTSCRRSVTANFMDLRGVACPMNFVKAKLRLEMMDIGETLELILDDGRPIENVPGSFRHEGQEVAEMTEIDDDHWRVKIVKKS